MKGNKEADESEPVAKKQKIDYDRDWLSLGAKAKREREGIKEHREAGKTLAEQNGLSYAQLLGYELKW